MACATDGAASMVGRYRGFIAHLKAAVPDVFCMHCVVHRQHLVAKKLGGRLHDSLAVVIKAVNFIKSNSLQDRIFQQLCEDNDEDFTQLLMHTEVRWLSKGNCLRRFVTLWESIVLFFIDKQLGEQIIHSKCDIFYLSDIFEKMNSLNKQLREGLTVLSYIAKRLLLLSLRNSICFGLTLDVGNLGNFHLWLHSAANYLMMIYMCM